MLLAIGFWATDSLHHITPAMVGLGVGLLAVLPGIGVLTYEEMKRCNYMMVFFVAAAASLGQVLTQTKALDLLTRALFSWMGPLITGRFSAVFVPYWAAFGYHIFLGNEISMLSTSVPPLIQFAVLHGLSPVATGMIWSFAAGGKIFVYQSAVMIVGYSFGYFDTRDMLRVGAILSFVESLLLLVVVPFYWPLIGIR
jgi:di/tricarboxylate transporter